MNTKEGHPENIKIRLTTSQKEIIDTTAKENGISVSDIIRHALFDQESSSPYVIAIRNNLFKNEVINMIQSLDVSKSSKEKFMKGMNTIGQNNL